MSVSAIQLMKLHMLEDIIEWMRAPDKTALDHWAHEKQFVAGLAPECLAEIISFHPKSNFLPGAAKEIRNALKDSVSPEMCEKEVAEALEQWKIIAEAALRKHDVTMNPAVQLSLMVDSCNIGLDWNPQTHLLTLDCPPANTLFSGYKLELGANGDIKHNDTPDKICKGATHKAMMDQLGALLSACTSNSKAISINSTTLALKNPPEIMLKALGIYHIHKPFTLHRDERGL